MSQPRTDRELIQQALEALEGWNHVLEPKPDAELISALRSRLAQPRKPMTVIYSPGELAARGLTHEDVVKLIKENT